MGSKKEKNPKKNSHYLEDLEDPAQSMADNGVDEQIAGVESMEYEAVAEGNNVLDMWEAVTVEPETVDKQLENTFASNKEFEVKIKEISEQVNSCTSAIETCKQDLASLKESFVALKTVVEGIPQTLKFPPEGQNKSKEAETYLGEISFDETPTISYNLDTLLQLVANHKASDLHVRAGNCPMVRLEGELLPVGKNKLTSADTKKLITDVMTTSQKTKLANEGSVNFARNIPGHRFRVTAYKQRGTIGAAIRFLRTDIPTFEELSLPLVMKRFANLNHGLVLVTGPAGSGKSTTLAAMVGYMNTTKKNHIITIEDPIEFVHQDNYSIITQREVGADTTSFFIALKEALRQDPNVILIGEMRDPETVWTAIMAAETGHLVFSSLHTHSTAQAIDRMIDFFSGEQQKQFRHLLAAVLKGVISLKLIQRADGKGRVPAVEVLVVTPTIASFIAEGNSSEIYPYIVQGGHEGMQTFTESLMKLYESAIITKEEALYHADHPTEFRLGIEGHTTGGATTLTIPGSPTSWV